MQIPYWVVDAFTDRVFSGNPAAVLLPPAALPDAVMQSIAAENNLSETAFAVAGPDGYHLRWFTPTVEVDMCGHATLATSFVLGLLGVAGPLTFHTRSGALTSELAGGRITLDFPARGHEAVVSPPGLEDVLGMAPVAVLRSADLIAVLPSPEAVRDLRPDHAKIAALPGGALIVTAAGGVDLGEGEAGVHATSRYFAPAYGIVEDPVTGSLHTQVVPYWASVLGRDTLVCHQASARGGMLWCERRGARVRMTGTAVLYANGFLYVR